MGRINILGIKKAITVFIFLCGVSFALFAWPVFLMGGTLVDLVCYSVAVSLIMTIILGLCE